VARFAGPAAGVGLGVALAVIAFIGEGGGEVGPNTGVQIALIVAGALVVAAALLFGHRGALYGASAVAVFAAFAALTALSVTWSVAPDLSWLEADRTLAYLAVFAGAVGAARVRPTAAPVLLRALVIAAVIVVGYALTARIWPGALADAEVYSRIGEPYGYSNAVGTTAALAIPAALWLGARRSGHPPANALAYPALGVLFVGLFLTASRGAILAGAIALALWFVVVPLRLRSLTVLGVSALGAAPVAIWALTRDAFTETVVPETVREGVAAELGLLLIVMALALALAGTLVGYRTGVAPPHFRWRRRAGLAVAIAGCGVLVAGFAAVALSDRGVTGTVSAQIEDVTQEEATTPGGPARLTTASSSRAIYWREAREVFEQRPVAGAGAGAFDTARLRYRKNELVTTHAHGYVAQTGADLGLLGLAATLALALAWLVAAARTVGVGPRVLRRRTGGEGEPEWSGDRVALCTLALVALAFGIHSVVDWTWFVPAPAVMAIAAAGFVAGRGRPGDAPPPGGARRLRGALAAAVLGTALLSSWAVWQPARAERSIDRARDLLAERRFDGALAAADQAAERNPVAVAPLLLKADIEQEAGRRPAAIATLNGALVEHPAEPRVWLALAQLELGRDRPRVALDFLRGAIYLDPRSKFVLRTVNDVQRALPAQPAPAPAPPSRQ